MKEIQLTRGMVALVDDEDYEWLNRWRWNAHTDHNGFVYATRHKSRRDGGGTVRMHRLIINTSEKEEIDHIDGNGLNNSRSNLRPCTHSQNAHNSGLQRNNRSGFKGVSWDSAKHRWRAEIAINRKHIFLGYFRDPIMAAYAYDDIARKYFGEFAKTNLPKREVIAK